MTWLKTLRIKYSDWKLSKLKIQQVDYAFRIGSSLRFMDSFQFHLKQELAKLDAKSDKPLDSKERQLELLNGLEACSLRALSAAMVERGRLL